MRGFNTAAPGLTRSERDSFELGLMSLADQSPCTSWLAQYERTEACRAALALDVSGWPASRSAVAPRLTPSIKQIAQQSRVSLRTRDDMPRPVAFGLTRPSCARRQRTVYRDIPARRTKQQSHAADDGGRLGQCPHGRARGSWAQFNSPRTEVGAAVLARARKRLPMLVSQRKKVEV